MPTTIKDIAKRLNISVSTVSYALNDGPRPVPAEVRDRVLAVARELDYRPNRIARQLVTRRCNAIGVVPAKINSHDLLLSQFVQYVVNAIVNRAHDSEQDVLLLSARHDPRSSAARDQLLDGRVDGVIFLASSDADHLATELLERKIPHVMVATHRRGLSPTVTVDNRAGARMALEHLYERGFRRIGHLRGRAEMIDAQDREAAFCEFVRDAGLDPDACPVGDGNFTQPDAERTVDSWIRSGSLPEAVFAANDESAIGLIQACRKHGVRVPDDVSVIGFDDIPLAIAVEPQLTTIRQPLTDMGEAAAGLLLDIIAGKEPETELRFEPTLVERSTVIPSNGGHTHS